MSYVHVCMNNQGTTSPLKIGLDKVTHCAGPILVNTRPHQLHWGEQEMGTVVSCTECSLIPRPYERPEYEASTKCSQRGEDWEGGGGGKGIWEYAPPGNSEICF